MKIYKFYYERLNSILGGTINVKELECKETDERILISKGSRIKKSDLDKVKVEYDITMYSLNPSKELFVEKLITVFKNRELELTEESHNIQKNIEKLQMLIKG